MRATYRMGLARVNLDVSNRVGCVADDGVDELFTLRLGWESLGGGHGGEEESGADNVHHSDSFFPVRRLESSAVSRVFVGRYSHSFT